jgi:hypothetical protein
MYNTLLIALLFLLSCSPQYISPHTKRGQQRIHFKSFHTPYHVDLQTLDAHIPFEMKWSGKPKLLTIEVEFIVRPTSPRMNFTITPRYLNGNSYTVYRDQYRIEAEQYFKGELRVSHRGDYRVRATLSNDYFSKVLSSYFKVS